MRNLEIVTTVRTSPEGKEFRKVRAYGVGRLTGDPSLKHVQSGDETKAVTENGLSIAVSVSKTETIFLTAVAWEKAAEHLAKYGRKGAEIFFSGVYTEKPYKSKTGEDKVEKIVTLENWSFTYGSKRPEISNESEENTGVGNEDFQSIEDDDDVPF